MSVRNIVLIELKFLRQNGYVHLRQLISHATLTRFETEIHRLGEAGLRRKRPLVSHNEPLVDLLQTGGDYRVRLFASPKNLKIVQEMSRNVAKLRENRDFLAWTRPEIKSVDSE